MYFLLKICILRFIVHLSLVFLIEHDQSFGKSDEILHLQAMPITAQS